MAQFYFVILVTKHLRERDHAVKATASGDPTTRLVSNRQTLLLLLFCFIGTALMLSSELGPSVVPHSVGLSFLAFISAFMLKMFDRVDREIVSAITGKPSTACTTYTQRPSIVADTFKTGSGNVKVWSSAAAKAVTSAAKAAPPTVKASAVVDDTPMKEVKERMKDDTWI